MLNHIFESIGKILEWSGGSDASKTVMDILADRRERMKKDPLEHPTGLAFCKLLILIFGFAGHVADDLKLRRSAALRLFGITKQHCALGRERVNVDLKPAAVIHKAVLHLAHAAERWVSLKHIAAVFLFGDRPFGVPLRAVGAEPAHY